MDITSELKKLADPKRAEGEKKYLKSPMQHYGVRVPELRKIAKIWLKEHKDDSIENILDFANQLWGSQYHEERMLAIFIVSLRKDQLKFSHLKVIEPWVKSVTGWAQLDGLAGWILGPIYLESPKQMENVMRCWVKDKNFWVRRAAILIMIVPLRAGKGDFSLFEELVVPLLSEKEFFIRKAIGWVLRDVSKVNSAKTKSFVVKYKDQMSGLTYREATKYLSL